MIILRLFSRVDCFFVTLSIRSGPSASANGFRRECIMYEVQKRMNLVNKMGALALLASVFAVAHSSPALADAPPRATIHVKNCIAESVQGTSITATTYAFYSYNSNDTIYEFWYDEKVIEFDKTADLRCATDSCKIGVYDLSTRKYYWSLIRNNDYTVLLSSAGVQSVEWLSRTDQTGHFAKSCRDNLK